MPYLRRGEVIPVDEIKEQKRHKGSERPRVAMANLKAAWNSEVIWGLTYTMM